MLHYCSYQYDKHIHTHALRIIIHHETTVCRRPAHAIGQWHPSAFTFDLPVALVTGGNIRGSASSSSDGTPAYKLVGKNR